MLVCANAHIAASVSRSLRNSCYLPGMARPLQKGTSHAMTSAEGVALAKSSLQGNHTALLLLLDAFWQARGDPMAESMVGEVKRFVYSRTEHSDEGMEKLISEAGKDLSHLAA